jgi:hypothetical protein
VAKISPTTRLILFVGIVLIGYFAYQDLSPAPATTTHHLTVTTQTALADGILPEDLHAHYARYVGGSRDPFLPGVFPPNSGGQGDLSGVGKHGGWSLTGINRSNGVASALVENDSTGDSVFLQVGDHWNGLTVDSIGDDSVMLENAFGQQTELSFPALADDTSTTAPSQNAQPAIPGLSQITPLPPLGAAGATGAAPAGQPALVPQPAYGGGGFGGRRGRGGRGGGFGGGGFGGG